MKDILSGIDTLLDRIPVPRMVRVAQNFERPRTEDIEAELLRGLESSRVFAAVVPGARVAVAVGSRGIANLPDAARIIVRELKKAGAEPFIVPAMGSHGGATAEGQKALLEHLGITERYTGAPIRSSMEVDRVGISPRFGMPVYIDKNALAADGIVIINRIKAHPAYAGKFESGLVKMTAIGLGKQKQAEIVHNVGAERMDEFVADIGLEALRHIKLIAAVGLVENAFHETARVVVLRKEEIEREEPVLLAESKRLAARFYIDEFEALIIDEIGKEISGAGFDTTIVGRYSSPFLTGGPKIRRVAVLDITEKSKGYGGGLGMVDFTTRRAFNKFDPEQTYPNTLTSTFTEGVKIPMILKNDRQAVQACVRTCNRMDYRDARIIRIKNTLCMEEISVSENLLDTVRAHPNMRILGEPEELVFDRDGNLF
jgi:hypothetical protein